MRLFLNGLILGLAVLGTPIWACEITGSDAQSPKAAPHYFQHNTIMSPDLSLSDVIRDLGPLLSHTASIFGPSDPRWKNATVRYNTLAMPNVQLVVQPGAEGDVSIIQKVEYCNRNSIDFMAVTRGHSFSTVVSRFRGIEIDMSSLQDYTIEPDGKSAWFQGGSYGGSVIQSLWDKGHMVTTGSCTCVGLVGPGLGGGHGRLEGLYGLISDNFINLNVVLANGSAIWVNATSHEDLWWAMRGAGHNFGIVTSFQMKIHPRDVDTWHYHTYIWSDNQLETVFERLNTFHRSDNGSTPVRMVNFGYFRVDQEYSPKETILSWIFAYGGPATEAESLLAPFNSIPAISSSSGDVPYPDIANYLGGNIDSSVCAPNNRITIRGAGTLTYNVTTERLIFDAFNAKVARYPELAPGAVAVHEGYANRAVQEVESDSTAFAWRDENHLMYVGIYLPEGSDQVDAAMEWADETMNLWNQGQPDRRPSTYVNYAWGDESLESMYGYESWRLEKLRALKREYDPENRFRFYNPIV
ncbi:hypothetical protein BDW74DRAFT_187971 [Aspergillus multicolor]|uniref:FAD-binding oxidoreductase n=1 Tax=Aspergillus multicolor TaxID=41759 RepID=UPI003CCD1AFD